MVAIEEPYFTWKHGGLEEGGKFWMMQNRSEKWLLKLIIAA
jgi:hypothetical protein